MCPMARLRRLGFAVNAADIGRSARPIRTGTRLEYSAESAPDRATAADDGPTRCGQTMAVRIGAADPPRGWDQMLVGRVTAVSDTAYGRG